MPHQLHIPKKPLKSEKVKVVKAKPMDPKAPRYSAFNEVIIPEKTTYKFKQNDVFELTNKKSNKKKGGRK
jgi:hypothetical protein